MACNIGLRAGNGYNRKTPHVGSGGLQLEPGAEQVDAVGAACYSLHRWSGDVLAGDGITQGR